MRGDLVCYARAVVSDEWPKMGAGAESEVVSLQSTIIGSITALVVSSLLVIHFLDHPFTKGGAYIPANEMATTVRLIDSVDGSITFPCDEEGDPS